MDNEQLVEGLTNMSVTDLCKLTRTLEEKWGVKAVAPTAPILSGNTDQEPNTTMMAQTEFTVVMKSFAPDKKMPVLKLVRELTGLGLKEVKDFMESLPKTVKENISRNEADELVTKLTEAGAEVTMQ